MSAFGSRACSSACQNRAMGSGRRRFWLYFVASMVVRIPAAGQGRVPLHWMPAATPLSAESPFPPACDAGQGGTHYRDAAVETWLAVDPNDPQHLVGSWQQDRWSNGGASGLVAGVSFDGGRSWLQSIPPFSVCSGGA